MEEFSKDELLKIEQSKQLFNVDTLTREQMEFILGRKIEPKDSLKFKVKKKKLRNQLKLSVGPKTSMILI